jgi:5'-nucleotidase
MKPAILLTNDDGVSSIGLWAAYDALTPIADVTVVAPATQQSAVGRSISIFEPLRATQVAMNGRNAWAVAGKPTDAVIIGLYSLKLRPAMVVSGINIGENLSTESIMTSGTVGAALEASNQGTKAIAFSLQVEDQGDKFDDPRSHTASFDAAKEIVRDVVSRVLRHGFGPDVDVINVNIPSNVTGGFEVTPAVARISGSTGRWLTMRRRGPMSMPSGKGMSRSLP